MSPATRSRLVVPAYQLSALSGAAAYGSIYFGNEAAFWFGAALAVFFHVLGELLRRPESP